MTEVSGEILLDVAKAAANKYRRTALWIRDDEELESQSNYAAAKAYQFLHEVEEREGESAACPPAFLSKYTYLQLLNQIHAEWERLPMTRRWKDVWRALNVPVKHKGFQAVEDKEEVAKALSLVPKEWRDAFWRHFALGVPYPELAKEEGCSWQNIRQKLVPIMKSIRRQMGAELG